MKKRLFVMNSAMMPVDGFYSKTTISPDDAREVFEELSATHMVVSALGYPNIRAIASSLFDYPLDLSRIETKFRKGDVAICFQLTYRIQAPGEKGLGSHGNHLDDYKISIVRYFGDRV